MRVNPPHSPSPSHSIVSFSPNILTTLTTPPTKLQHGWFGSWVSSGWWLLQWSSVGFLRLSYGDDVQLVSHQCCHLCQWLRDFRSELQFELWIACFHQFRLFSLCSFRFRYVLLHFVVVCWTLYLYVFPLIPFGLNKSSFVDQK